MDLAVFMLRDQQMISGVDAHINDFLPEFSMTDVFEVSSIYLPDSIQSNYDLFLPTTPALFVHIITRLVV